MMLPPLFHVTQALGATQSDGDEASGRIKFRLFFPAGFDPNITEIRAAGDFQPQLGGVVWDFANGFALTKTTQAEGDFWEFVSATPIPSGFYQYKYQVTFTDGTVRKVTDPYARYSGTDSQNAGVVIGGSRASDNTVSPLPLRKPLRDLVVYEMHPGDFTDEYRGLRAPFDAVRDKLQYLVALGVEAILFMPWTAWHNKDYDWGYAPFQYFAVEYAYANDLARPNEKLSLLKQLIDECHKANIHVIMDGVFNHCSEDFPYKQLYRNDADCPYTAGPFGGTFPGLQDLDFNNDCTQAFIRDVCLYWISQFGIDGIRFDNTVNYYVAGNPRGIPQLLSDIQSYVTANGQSNFSMTLEHLDLSAAALVNSSDATSYWDNQLYGECFFQLYNGAINPVYLAALNNSQYVNGPGKIATSYLSNHDHSAVAWQAGAKFSEGAFRWYRTQPHAIALFTSSAAPLIANGQEFAEDHWIPEDDHGTGRRIRPRPLRWAEVTDGYGAPLLALYTQLFQIRKAHPALRSQNFYPPTWNQPQRDADGFGVDVAQQVVVFHRWGTGTAGTLERFIIALNFSDQAQPVELQFPANGAWADLLAATSVTVANFRLTLTLEPNWGHIFFLG
ncbi:alpha-amylase family glycosyl hydrolase [Acidisphaera sp. L21]|uniref:alpha-amylase family glycosyl hydrolase n=1 Tax=Acidisphaera sp. L21 TaxID=1641851 RepID=UPI00131E87D9|nr:alpha-amylase family glycosyl hydrolase [Acidisphaera sp. L21]